MMTTYQVVPIVKISPRNICLTKFQAKIGRISFRGACGFKADPRNDFKSMTVGIISLDYLQNKENLSMRNCQTYNAP